MKVPVGRSLEENGGHSLGKIPLKYNKNIGRLKHLLVICDPSRAIEWNIMWTAQSHRLFFDPARCKPQGGARMVRLFGLAEHAYNLKQKKDHGFRDNTTAMPPFLVEHGTCLLNQFESQNGWRQPWMMFSHKFPNVVTGSLDKLVFPRVVEPTM